MEQDEKKSRQGRAPNSLKNLKPIRKGEVRNPHGARAHDPVKKELKRFTNKYLIEIIEMAVMGNLAGLKAVVDNPDSPAIQVGVAKSLFNAISEGDWSTLESIVSRIIGKVPDKVDFTGTMKSLQIEFVGKKEK